MPSEAFGLPATDLRANATEAARSDVAAVAFDLLAGSIGGMAGIVLGHPLDVVKTRQQAAASSIRTLSVFECCKVTYRAEGTVGLWRGLAPPLLSVGLYQSTLFATHQWTYKQASSGGMQEERASLLAGAISGAASCFITVPFDAVKIQLQLEKGGSSGALK
ncbi:unnamed protein product, partial [Polarella glacialis]